MQAAILRSFGGEVEIVDVPTPRPGAAEVLLEAVTAAVTFADLLVMQGRYQELPSLPFTPGKGCAGIVSEVGAEVTGLRPGDHVAGFGRFCGAWGGNASGSASERSVIRIPENIPLADAAALGVAAQTAYLALVDRAELQPGQTVLITGASGSVGLAAVEIAKALGARVFAGIRGSRAAQLLKTCGADEIVDLSMADLRDGLRSTIQKLTGGKGVDCIIDNVGGSVFEAGLRALAFRGRMVGVGFAGKAAISRSVKTNYLLLKTIAVTGMYFNDYWVRDAKLIRTVQTKIDDFIAGGRLGARIAALVPLARTSEAVAILRNGGVDGRVVVSAP